MVAELGPQTLDDLAPVSARTDRSGASDRSDTGNGAAERDIATVGGGGGSGGGGGGGGGAGVAAAAGGRGVFAAFDREPIAAASLAQVPTP